MLHAPTSPELLLLKKCPPRIFRICLPKTKPGGRECCLCLTRGPKCACPFRLSCPLTVGLFSSIDLFGTYFYQVVIDSLNSSRGGGKDTSLICYFHVTDLPCWPGAVGAPLRGCARTAIATSRLDLLLVVLVVPPVIFSYRHLFRNTGVWGRRPCPPARECSLCWW